MRLFVAILLNDSVKSKLTKLQRKLDARCDGVRWTKPEQLHLTAKFIGEVKDPEVPAVCDALARAASKSQRFTMNIAGCGCFPSSGSVRIVWAGINEESGALHRCVEAVESELEALGYPRERKPFSAHITMGRMREDRSDGRFRSTVEQCVLETKPQDVSTLVLMSSVLSSSGPTHAVASTMKLGIVTNT